MSDLAALTDDTRARAWLDALASRGVTVSLVHARLRLQPPSAYYELTDDEILTLRHLRKAIKDAVTAQRPSDPPPVVAPPSGVERGPACPYCYHAPCIGPDHKHFVVLHPLARQQASAAYNTRVMLAALANY